MTERDALLRACVHLSPHPRAPFPLGFLAPLSPSPRSAAPPRAGPAPLPIHPRSPPRAQLTFALQGTDTWRQRFSSRAFLQEAVDWVSAAGPWWRAAARARARAAGCLSCCPALRSLARRSPPCGAPCARDPQRLRLFRPQVAARGRRPRFCPHIRLRAVPHARPEPLPAGRAPAPPASPRPAWKQLRRPAKLCPPKPRRRRPAAGDPRRHRPLDLRREGPPVLQPRARCRGARRRRATPPAPTPAPPARPLPDTSSRPASRRRSRLGSSWTRRPWRTSKGGPGASRRRSSG